MRIFKDITLPRSKDLNMSSLNKKKTFKLFYYIKDITIIKSIFTLT